RDDGVRESRKAGVGNMNLPVGARAAKPPDRVIATLVCSRAAFILAVVVPGNHVHSWEWHARIIFDGPVEKRRQFGKGKRHTGDAAGAAVHFRVALWGQITVSTHATFVLLDFPFIGPRADSEVAVAVRERESEPAVGRRSEREHKPGQA